MANTSDLLVQRLIDWGVDTIFGLPGDGINGVFDALRTHREQIKFVQVRHEEAAAFAACAYAKFTGRPGVCIATSGPGGIHLLNGLYDAKMDGQPVIAITGHTFHDLIGQHQQQDVALDKLFDDVAVYSERVSGPHHVENVVDEAFRLALSRRGVAHVNLPKDVQLWEEDATKRSKRNVKGHSAVLFEATRSLPRRETLQAAADVINAGGKVAIMAGRGALGAREELERLAEAAAAPIIKPLLGKGVVPDDSPYTTGGIGLLGTTGSQKAIENCDTLVLVGTSMPYEAFYPKPGQARAVQIDVDPARIGLRYPVEVGLVGDAKATLAALLPLIEHKDDRGFLEDVQSEMRDWWQLMEERGTRTDTPMKPQVVSWELGKLLRDDAIVTGDSGTIATWISRQWKLRDDQMFSVSGNLATMACALPYAVGAQIAYPNRQVVAFVGDGGLTMLIGELATLVKYELPVKVVVIKNDTLGMIKWEQMILDGFPEYGVELQPIDFVKAAEAFGITGFRLEDPRQARGTIAAALEHDGPALVEAVVDPLEPPMPPMVTREQAIQFAKALVKGQPQRLEIATTAAGDLLRQVI